MNCLGRITSSKESRHITVDKAQELSSIIGEIYKLTNRLEAMYPGRHFTPDGHLVGSIGEVHAAEKYGL
ncbi:MAG: hypothetical protein U0J70_08535, partial [Atopobiaceae bacterium]|nr:hypothetical protein [Atopobiaceae bacterium]